MVLCTSDGTVQTGIDISVELLRSAIERFEIAAAKLAFNCAGDEALARDIGTFVQGCRYVCMGSYTWRSVLASDTNSRAC